MHKNSFLASLLKRKAMHVECSITATIEINQDPCHCKTGLVILIKLHVVNYPIGIFWLICIRHLQGS